MVFAATFAPIPAHAQKSVSSKIPPAIRIAPPAPRISDAARKAEFAKRRSNVAAEIGKNGALILFSAEPKIYTNDVDFQYRQENNLYYLIGLKQQHATLVLMPGKTPSEILFVPERDPANETWNGRMYSREEAQNLSGVRTIVDAREFPAFVEALKNKRAFSAKGVSISGTAENLFLLLPGSERDDDGLREFRREFEFAKDLAKISVNERTKAFGYEPLFGYKIQDAQPIFAELRLVKSPMEIKMLQHAVDITTEGFGRAMGVAPKIKHEYEAQAEIEYTFRRRNADYWGYPSIVGCGPNATTLHYVESQGAVRRGDLLLMDVGAEYEHYTADVTRTFPVSGKFTKAQAEIYQIVYDAQEAVGKATKPGANLRNDVYAPGTETIKKGLAKLGLITAPDATYKIKLANGQFFDVPQFRLWFMHGVGHWLGMNVHDVGEYNTPLKPGMIFTNEPGVYIRGDALDYALKMPENADVLAKIRPAFEKYKNIGVRIEDDLLVTATGVTWMTKNLPRKLKDVEAMMARTKLKMRSVAANEDLPQENFLLELVEAKTE